MKISFFIFLLLGSVFSFYCVASPVDLDDAVIKQHVGDLEGLYKAWFQSTILANKESAKIAIVAKDADDLDRQYIEIVNSLEKTFKYFCEISGGAVTKPPTKLNFEFRCTSNNDVYIGSLKGLGNRDSNKTARLYVKYETPKTLAEKNAERLEHLKNAKLNGPSGWVDTTEGKFHFIRIGDIDKRDVIFIRSNGGEETPIENIHRINFSSPCCDISVQPINGSAYTVNLLIQDLTDYSAQTPSPFSSTYGIDGFPIVFLNNDGKPYVKRYPNFEGINSIEIDTEDEWKNKSGNEVIAHILYKDGANATDVNKLKKYIAAYENNDPDGLVNKAKSKLYEKEFRDAASDVDYQDFINKYANDDSEKLIPKAKEKLKLVLSQQKAEAKKLAQWRSQLQEGDSTNCGIVIEKKSKLVKVALTSSNAERWLKLEQVLQPGSTCQFDSDRIASNQANPIMVPVQANPVTENHSHRFTIGDSICTEFNGTERRVIAVANFNGQELLGPPEERFFKIRGFVESANENKIQIRINGIKSLDLNRLAQKDIDKISRNMGMEYKVGALIWDDEKVWHKCV